MSSRSVDHKNNKHDMKRKLLHSLLDDCESMYHDGFIDAFIEYWNAMHPAYMRLSAQDIEYLCSLEPRFVITFHPRKLTMVGKEE